MIPDLPFIQRTYDKFNSLCFGGALPPVPFKLTSARTFLGKVAYKVKRGILRGPKIMDCSIRISTSFDLPEAEWEDVIIHEMIHYHILMKGIRDTSSHGQVFRSMMDGINSNYGRHITVRHRCKEGSGPSRKEEIRENWLCVTQLQNGSWGITSCAGKRAPEIHRGLPECYRLRSLAWYVSSDPFFNRYPRSIKPRIYKITRAELDEHLKGSTPLGCEGSDNFLFL